MRVTLFGGRLAQAGTGPATTIAATVSILFRFTSGAGQARKAPRVRGISTLAPDGISTKRHTAFLLCVFVFSSQIFPNARVPLWPPKPSVLDKA